MASHSPKKTDSAITCAGKTVKGVDCKNKPLAGQAYCRHHGGVAEALPEAAGAGASPKAAKPKAKPRAKPKPKPKLKKLSPEDAYEMLLEAAEDGNFEQVKHAIKFCSNPHEDNESLKAAIRSGKAEIVRFLLKDGAEVDASDPRPLDQAVEDHNLEIAELLLKAGNLVISEPEEDDEDNQFYYDEEYNLLEFSLRHNMPEMAQLIVKFIQPQRHLSKAVLAKELKIVELLIGAGAVVSQAEVTQSKGNEAMTALLTKHFKPKK